MKKEGLSMKSFQAKSMKQQNSNSRFGNAKGLINASGKAEHNLQKPKIAFVCQRYGLEVNGGSELYCRQIAERLTSRYDVTVYTSCALDYATWANKYKPGTEDINGVHVKRYKVIKERNHKAFDEISAIVVNPNHTDAQEQEWFDKQGPLCPGAVEAIKQEHGQYEAVLFMTYLYYLTVKGFPLNLNNAALIPTVHDEPWVYLHYYDTVFGSAKALVWNTEEEKTFALRRFPSIADKPDVMTGIGVDVPLGKLPELPEKSV